MPPKKQLWLLTGGNGSGKSTFYERYLKPLGVPFVNADNIAKELYPDSPEAHSYHASQIAEQLRYELLQSGRSFCFETVFSHPTKIDFVGRAKALGYEVILVFIHLASAQLNKARVAQRVELGGHSVPDDKVEARIPRVLQNTKTVIPLCDQVRILDNSRSDNPFVPVLVIKDGKLTTLQDNIPEWADFLCGVYET